MQFGVKTMLVVVFLACLLFAWLAYLSRSGRQQRAAATAFQQRGASVQYDRPLDKDRPLPAAVSDGPIGAFADMFAPQEAIAP
jgi:predicted negative regulator of RcsB-dependent stress response